MRKIDVYKNHWYGHGTGSMAKEAYTLRLHESDEPRYTEQGEGRYYLRNNEAARPTLVATVPEDECPVNLEFLDNDCPVLVFEPQNNDDDHENSERDYDWCESLANQADPA